LTAIVSNRWHLVTGEYPPQAGGVSDYTHLVARELAATGDEVHVWCPSAKEAQSGSPDPAASEIADSPGVIVHREFRTFASADLRRVGKVLDQFAEPRRLLVQWVPHGYGYRAMNLPFCFWLWRRARHGDRVELMVHEPYLGFGEGSWKQNSVALVHRLMTMILLRAARRVWISIPAWESLLRPYALGRGIPFEWLPVVSNIPVIDDAAGVKAIRARYTQEQGALVGHFGAYDRHLTDLLLKSIPALMQNGRPQAVLLLGRGSEAMRDELTSKIPTLVGRVHASGTLAADELSRHVSACDLMLQPYIDGVSTRRTSTMVALAHGVPVVTTSGPLTEPLWAESQAVALAPVADLPELVETIQRLLPDAVARKHMSAAARSLYAERFDVEHIIASLRAAAE
jgi:glycosyltransferase involved in cell wall biosynthesis